MIFIYGSETDILVYMAKKDKFLIIDGNAILHRAWHSLPPTMTTQDGIPVNAVYGFLTTFFKALQEFKPKYAAVTFDRKEKTFRHEEYKEYKATRIVKEDELYAQIPIIKKVLQAMNVKLYDKVGYEADDIIGTLCEHKLIDQPNILSVIVTGDLDTLQLVDNNTRVFTMRKGMSDTITYDINQVKEKYDGLKPEQLIDYKGLRGDPSDNIPGVPGVGEKTAIGLIKQFGSMENMYKNIEPKEYKHIKVTERIHKLLKENKKQAEQSKRLATIVRDVKIDFKIKDCLLGGYDKEEVYDIFHELEFKSLLNKLPEFAKVAESQEQSLIKHEANQHDYRQVKSEKEFAEFLREIKKQDFFVFDTETDSLDVLKAKLLGISFSWQDKKAYYVEAKKNWLEKLKPVFENKKTKKAGHNLKFDFEIMRLAGIMVENLHFDTMVASYLLNPGTRNHKLDDLVFREFGYQMTKITDLIGAKGKGQVSMALVDGAKVSLYACEDADYTWRLIKPLRQQLKENKLEKLFSEMEMPLIEVLAEMEINGVKVDVEHLKNLRDKLKRRIDALTGKIHKAAGRKFNIASPKQLKEILFDELEIDSYGLSRTKTGISTAAGELEKLQGRHEIIDHIIEYRELTKLQSTYIEALPKLINKQTGRIHTDFNQTITSTGRLSSSNPNLQNIPIRNDLGKEIRKAFVSERGYRLVAADYSQVELRVIACLAQDENMIKVFKNNQDIHTVTAAKIFHVKESEVTKDMRSAAKEVNFGVLYGMGAWGLAARKKISRAEAKEFIDEYFKNYHKVKAYLEEIKELAAENEYVETVFGRRRYLPEINSGVRQVRASAERMAVNMPIQGTAADLMKIAMIQVYHELKKVSPKSKLILQVHDELVIECPKDEVGKVAKIVDEKMEKIHKLCVPIKVDTEAGENWQEMKKIA